jgi:NAD(P)-dependent dehydrogenase (short-subunit alcohol dehydrogenase family)
MERTAPYRSLTSPGKRPRGIGRAIVERMAEHGAHVVVSSRHVEPCREVAAINVRLGELDRRAGLQLRCDTDASRLR